ncbi:MAG: multiheme c-type cytochrome [Syntrophobacteraceae bacterium]
MRRLLSFFFTGVCAVCLCAGAIHSRQVQDDDNTLEQSQPSPTPSAANETCVECHTRITPGIVVDWQLSKHSRNDVECSTCHGDGHNSMTDIANAKLALPATCAACHETQVEQFGRGKHALAWGAMKAMPTLHWQPMAQVEGLKGCGGCHRVGLKTEGEIKGLVEKGAGFGATSCDVCHTRHLFSADEAKSPQSCRTCHMGPDHPQWEMYSSSKHGVRFMLKQSRILPEEAVAPTCQSCHFQDGNHANRTAWGYLALRMPLPEDEQWAKDRTAILQALGILDPSGQPTPRATAVESVDLMRLTNQDWQAERDKSLKYCNDCHSVNFARAELEKGDQLIREADAVLAEGIRQVAALYQDGILKKPESYSYAFPDLLAMHDASTTIELKLFTLFHEYRMRTFQGAFHCSPDYTFWYGWGSMQKCLVEIKERAAEMRAAASKSTEQSRPGGARKR